MLDIIGIAVEVETMSMYDQAPNPRGTPWEREAVEEVQLLILMNCCLFVRYDFSQGEQYV